MRGPELRRPLRAGGRIVADLHHVLREPNTTRCPGWLVRRFRSGSDKRRGRLFSQEVAPLPQLCPLCTLLPPLILLHPHTYPQGSSVVTAQCSKAATRCVAPKKLRLRHITPGPCARAGRAEVVGRANSTLLCQGRGISGDEDIHIGHCPLRFSSSNFIIVADTTGSSNTAR
jgi:hypothetical protein